MKVNATQMVPFNVITDNQSIMKAMDAQRCILYATEIEGLYIFVRSNNKPELCEDVDWDIRDKYLAPFISLKSQQKYTLL